MLKKSMLRWVSIFSLCALILWILPLGYFIKPAIEKLACGGQRSICMCRGLVVKNNLVPVSGYGIKSAPVKSSQEYNPSVVTYYLTAVFNQHIDSAMMSLAFSSNPVLMTQLYSRVCDHVPKTI